MATDDLNVLVIGGTGRVGRMLRRHWDSAAPRDIVLTWQSRDTNRDIRWDAANGAAALAAHGPFDRVLVLAGVTPAQDADLDQNAAIARAAMAAAAQMGAAHVLLASSSAVYGTARTRPYTEADEPDPSNPYGMAKLEAERAVLEALNGPPACAMRIGNVLGADALMLNAARAQHAAPVTLDRFRDGNGPLRSYIGPVTFARVLETLLHKGPTLPDILNVAAPAPVAMQTLLELSGTPYVTRPASSDAVQTITLDCSALTLLHPFGSGAATAGAMLGEWHGARDAA